MNPKIRFWHLLLASLLLTLAGDRLFLGHRPGLGWATCAALLWGTLALLRGTRPRALLLLAPAMLATAAQMAWRPSLSNLLAAGGITLLAAGLWSPLAGPLGTRAGHAAASLLASPRRWIQGAPEIWAGAGSVGIPSGGAIARPLVIALPAVALSAVFLVLLSGGNAILGEAVGSAFSHLFRLLDIRFPTPAQIIFWPAACTIALGLLWRPARAAWLDKLGARADRRLREDKSPDTAALATRIALVAVNVLFFAANTLDVIFLWLHTDLPAGTTAAEFVHEGTGNLIACTLLAGLVITLMWRQAENVIGARWLRGLALAWIVQNLLLVASVLLRLGIYVDRFQLSAQRLHLALFLVLVVAGFALLAIYVTRQKSATWLLGSNLLAVLTLFATLQFWDTRASVANYNVADARKNGRSLDVEYLASFGHPAWPALLKVASPGHGNVREHQQARSLLLAALGAAEESTPPWADRQLAHERRLAETARQLAGD